MDAVQNGRLRVGLGEFEALFGSFEAAFRKLVAQSFVGLVEGLFGQGKFLARSRPIPTVWDPWPGKMKAIAWSVGKAPRSRTWIAF